MLNPKKKNEESQERTEITSAADSEVKATTEYESALPEPSEAYSTAQWRGTLNVYICNICMHCSMHEDDMKIHVVSHYPEAQRAGILDKLVKENK